MLRKKIVIGILFIAAVVMLFGCTKEKGSAEGESASLSAEQEANIKTITSQVNIMASNGESGVHDFDFALLYYCGTLYKCYSTIECNEDQLLTSLGTVYGYGSSDCFSDTELEAENQYDAELFEMEGYSKEEALAVKYSAHRQDGSDMDMERIAVFTPAD